MFLHTGDNPDILCFMSDYWLVSFINDGLEFKVRLLESVASAPISIHPVARLPSGPVQSPDAIDRHKVRLCRDHIPEPSAFVVLLLKNTVFFKWDSWWWPDDWKQQEYKYSQWRGDKGPRAPNHGSVDWLQSRESGWVDHRFVCFERFSFNLGSSPFVIFNDGVSLIR